MQSATTLYFLSSLKLHFFLSVPLLFSPVAGAGELSLELASLVARALAEHPRLAEARAQAEQARARYREEYGFFDPALYLAGGAADQRRGVPGLDGLGSMSSEAYEMQAGLQMPVRPGFYFNLGLVERQHRNLPAAGERHESVAGLGLRIPLLQDRGFKIWQLRRLRLLADWDRALNHYLAERQSLRHEVEQAYINLCESMMRHEIANEATSRLEILLGQAERLVEQKEIAEYQIFAARMEVDLSRAEELAARQAVQVGLVRLAELLGGRPLAEPELQREQWLRQSAALKLPAWDEAAPPFYNRGDYLQVLHQRVQAELSREAAEEEKRGDLSLQAAATWRQTDQEAPFAGARPDAPQWGGHVMLVYQRPLGFRAERQRLARHSSRISELEARLRNLELIIACEGRASAARFQYATARFAESERAVDSARRNLQAENQRFRLGEARSRDVLDAQNDMTKAERQQVATAAELQRAWSDYCFAAGYWRQEEEPEKPGRGN